MISTDISDDSVVFIRGLIESIFQGKRNAVCQVERWLRRSYLQLERWLRQSYLQLTRRGIQLWPLSYLRKIIVQGRSSKSTKVGDIMTEENKLITVTPDTKVLKAMQLMIGTDSDSSPNSAKTRCG